MASVSSSSSLPLFCTLSLAILAAVAAAAGKEFQVGDAVGWRLPVSNETQLYNVWASRRRFHVGDSLRFRYKNDSVVVVSKWGFYHCDSSNPIAFFNDGDTLLNLENVGTMYFISGNADRCQAGQRMILEVMGLPGFPPTVASPPGNPYDDISPSPSQLPGSSASSGYVTAVSVSVSVIALVVGLAGLGSRVVLL